MTHPTHPTFLERIQSFDATGKPGRVGPNLAKAMADGTWRPGPTIDTSVERVRCSHVIPEHSALRVTAERKLIGAIRKALKEYDRTVKPDGRRNNGKRVDPKAVAKGLKLMNSGMSIRRAAAVTGTSFGTLWKAQQAKQMKLDV